MDSRPASLVMSAGESDSETSACSTSQAVHESADHGALPIRTLDTAKMTVGNREATPGPSSESSQAELLSKLLHGKEKEWAAVAEKQGPLQLLDLPVDILKEIVKEITHTNDLTSLALTHSALHRLAIPHIYSRFDIVWPDAHATSDNRTGVDALTYGLATLVMGEEVFTPVQSTAGSSSSRGPKRQRRGNYFAQFTRKFSLGNGPTDWIQEYLITKEGGKMLGTLVAMAVARMHNLETFVWDMPTGVLRDVWIALASLGERQPEGNCRLERIWVRWHDNSGNAPAPQNNPGATMPSILPATSSLLNPSGDHASLFHIPPYPRVEFPTFSILPSLKSLTVLDIDELPYVEEMSVLIERSIGKLQELRIGIAPHAETQPWVRLPESRPMSLGQGAAPVGSPSTKAGGLLGILVSRICDVESNALSSMAHSRELAAQTLPDLGGEIKADQAPPVQQPSPPLEAPDSALSQPSVTSPPEEGRDELNAVEAPAVIAPNAPLAISTVLAEPVPPPDTFPNGEPGSLHQTAKQSPDEELSASLLEPFDAPGDVTNAEPATVPTRNNKLTLEVLELERVPLSIPVLLKAIDWTRLTSLTILRCQHHEQLWKALRKRYTPQALGRLSTSFKTNPGPFQGLLDKRRSSSSKISVNPEDFPLKIKKLQTDAVSPSLIAFIKDTLAPDSLEWLFLQEGRPYVSAVQLDSIYRGAIRRHRGSLRKLLIDSEDRAEDGQPASNHRWRKWAFNREVLTFITSGRMTKLRELGMAIEYKDWHFFLQRLPDMLQLRSIYIPYIADHVHGRNLDSRELALQILDIVALRPELEICYLGIQSKCFEILEFKPNETSAVIPDVALQAHPPGPGDSDLDSDSEPDGDGEPTIQASGNAEAHVETESETSSDMPTDDEDDLYGTDCRKSAIQFRLREILFYDDKVSIFKARHGKL